MKQYEALKKKLCAGWNTWNTRSVLSHVLLPEGLALNLAIKEYRSGGYLKEALIGRFGEEDEQIHPGMHAYDGSYTELNLKWKDIEVVVQSAVIEGELVLLVTPLKNQVHPATLVLEAGMLWNRPGAITLSDDRITAVFSDTKIHVHTTGNINKDYNIAAQSPYLAVTLDKAVGFSTGVSRTIEQIKEIVEENKLKHKKTIDEYGDLSQAYSALQSCMAWDTIYEPQKDRVITPVSRLWSVGSGGYVLFCWDTYFAAYMASIDNKELAYANAIEITKEKSEEGFVPNASWGTGVKTRDRSQPPVGSMVVKELYRKFKDKWLLEELFEDLYQWNTWFYNNRQIEEGMLCWGSNAYRPLYGNQWESDGVNNRYGGALESGLDNSPMYDDIPFNKDNNCLELADVGLMGLYIMDCHALADIALVLGRESEAQELSVRASKVDSSLQDLWSEEDGFFLNKRTDTKESSHRISPTNFYALFSSNITDEQKQRILKEHFYNPKEFYGEWIMPSIARNDPAYKEQDYWRGRIWAPMNFLVYLAFRKQGLVEAQKHLAEKSVKLLLKEWLEQGHVHENYSADTGEGCDKANSDKFYHWGALLALIALIENGFLQGPEGKVPGTEELP
jgi:putative isomerase